MKINTKISDSFGIQSDFYKSATEVFQENIGQFSYAVDDQNEYFLLRNYIDKDLKMTLPPVFHFKVVKIKM